MAKYAKRGRFWVSVAAALIAMVGVLTLSSTLQPASAVAPFPQAVSGTATLNGAAAPDSAVITVQIGGVTCTTNPATVNPSGGSYFLAIVYTEPAPCPATGPTTFFINGLQAGAPVSFTSNPQFNVNISAGAAGPGPSTIQFALTTTNVTESDGTEFIEVTRTGDTTGTASVMCTVNPGTATTPADYTATTNQPLDFAAGETSKNCRIDITQDTTPESPSTESLTLTLSGVTGTGASLGTPSTHTVNITDDDEASIPVHGTVQYAASSFGPAVEGGAAVTINVSRTGASNETAGVSVNCVLVALQGGATGADTTNTLGTASWAANENSTKSCGTVTALADSVSPETGEGVQLGLGDLTGGVSAGSPTFTTVAFTDVPPAAAQNTVQFSPAAYTVSETGGSVTLTVTRTGTVGNVSVSFATSNLTATAGSDYTAASGTLTWSQGDTSAKTIVVTILNDSVVDPGEQFRVTLSEASCEEFETLRQGCVVTIAGTNPATVTITDDEVPPTQIIPTATATLQGGFIPPAAFTPSPTATATPTQTPTSTPVPPTPTRAPATATAVPATATAVAPTATIQAPRPPATGTGTASTEVSWFMIVGAVCLMVAGTAIVARRTVK